MVGYLMKEVIIYGLHLKGFGERLERKLELTSQVLALSFAGHDCTR